MTDVDLNQEVMDLVDKSGATGDEIRDLAERLEQFAELKDKQREVMLR